MDTNENLVGQMFPEIMMLPISTGGKISFPKDIKGQWTLLYFYPKDDTPGCTKQACSYRDRMADFKKLGVRVLGISSDAMGSHQQFIEKYNLNFPLVTDLHNIVGTALGSYGDQEWNGKKFKGTSRDTFLISPEGEIRKVWRKVNPESTVEETRKYIEEQV